MTKRLWNIVIWIIAIIYGLGFVFWILIAASEKRPGQKSPVHTISISYQLI